MLTGSNGQTNNTNDIKVVGSGKTYDSKLYIFEEVDYRAEFQFLEITVEKVPIDP